MDINYFFFEGSTLCRKITMKISPTFRESLTIVIQSYNLTASNTTLYTRPFGK